jgi:hypothetical protein
MKVLLFLGALWVLVWLGWKTYEYFKPPAQRQTWTFTGAPLNPALGLYQCTTCQVYYHAASIEVLREENSGRCVARGSTALVARGAQEARTSRGRDATVDSTLSTGARPFLVRHRSDPRGADLRVRW